MHLCIKKRRTKGFLRLDYDYHFSFTALLLQIQIETEGKTEKRVARNRETREEERKTLSNAKKCGAWRI
jgi:hypothetical protein